MKFLINMLSEDGTAENVSTMRVATLLIVMLILVPRVITTVKTGATPALTTEEVGMVVGALGIKAWQRGKEGEPSPKSEAPKP